MTVYGKILNNEFVPAPYGEIEDLINQGYLAFTDEEAQKFITKKLIQGQIDKLDKQRIRAMAEPSIKDEETNQTWLEYYTQQIINLRTQIAEI